MTMRSTAVFFDSFGILIGLVRRFVPVQRKPGKRALGSCLGRSGEAKRNRTKAKVRMQLRRHATCSQQYYIYIYMTVSLKAYPKPRKAATQVPQLPFESKAPAWETWGSPLKQNGKSDFNGDVQRLASRSCGIQNAPPNVDNHWNLRQTSGSSSREARISRYPLLSVVYFRVPPKPQKGNGEKAGTKLLGDRDLAQKGRLQIPRLSFCGSARVTQQHAAAIHLRREAPEKKQKNAVAKELHTRSRVSGIQ